MMNYRLFLLDEAVEFLLGLSSADRRFLRAKLEAIRDFPTHHAEYYRRDATGRRIDGCVAGKFAIEFWEDTANMDLKIISITWADGRSPRRR